MRKPSTGVARSARIFSREKSRHLAREDTRLAERDPASSRDLELAAASAIADDEALFARFEQAITEATRIHDFIDYGRAGEFAADIERVLDQVAELVAKGQAELVLRLLELFFARMEDALDQMDDSGAHGAEAYARGLEIHLAACREARPDPVGLARDLFARETDGSWDFFGGASETYADVLGETGLAEYRRLAHDGWRKIEPRRAGKRRTHDPQYGARFRLGAILKGFAERDGDVDAGIAVRAKDLSTAYDYLEVATYCRHHGREADAMKWAEEGSWLFEDAPDERLTLFAADQYERVGRVGDGEALLWRAFD